jgi:proteasome lid subunit RPN8/RPN11
VVQEAVPVPNSYTGPQEDFFVIDPKDLHRVDRESREKGLDLLGVFHSHPDCDAYFSKRDLEHSCPWFSYVVLSIKGGRFDHANSYRPDFDQKEAPKEELIYG